MTFSWINGRQLGTVKKNGSTVGTYAYDSDGMRIKKTAGGLATTYHVMNGVCYGETRSDGRNLQYVFDENGRVIGFRMQFDTGSARFYFVFNAQGDVVQLLDSWGNVRANYSYDTWGRCTATDSNGNALSSDSIGMINPFRYRGYYYDNETGLYYASSRYYDPEVCRFISPDTADVLTATPMALTDKNLFAYCDNNPVMREDKDGQFWNLVIGAAGGALFSGIAQMASNFMSGKKLSDGLGMALVTGAASGLLAATGIGLVGSIAGNAAISMAGNAANQVIESNGFSNFNVGDMLIDGVIGGVAGAIGGKGMGKSANIKTLNGNLTKKVFSGSLDTARKGIKYYVSQTKYAYREYLVQPLIYAGAASLVGYGAKNRCLK